MHVAISPLTPDLWPDFEDLFGKQGACYGCWCTHFRLPPAARRDNDRERNKEHIRARIAAGPPPGLLAFADDADASDPGVWAISCFFLRSRVRGTGLTHRLVEEGIAFARQGGARFVEACPMTQSRSTRSIGLFVGSTRVFEKAGFLPMVERKAGRPLMRYVL
jgi:predicted GNAT family acetyltransferase